MHNLIVEHESMLAEHHAGRNVLDSSRQVVVEQQLAALYHSVEKLTSESPEAKLERIKEHQQAFYNMQRSDYIEWGKTGLSG